MSEQESEQEKEEIIKNAIKLGELVGTYGNKKQIEIFEWFINDWNTKAEAVDKQQKVIDLMAEQMSKRPLMIFQGNEKENSVEILKEPKEIIDYYTKKAEE